MLKSQRALVDGTKRALTARRGARGKVRVKERLSGDLWVIAALYQQIK
jgi:hypothetical protein